MIIVDSSIVDLYANDKESAINKIDRLFKCLDLMKRLKDVGYVVGISSSTLVDLSDCNQYPERLYIDRFLTEHDISEYDSQGIVSAINSILLGFEDIDNFLSCKEIQEFSISDNYISNEIRNRNMQVNSKLTLGKAILEESESIDGIIADDNTSGHYTLTADIAQTNSEILENLDVTKYINFIPPNEEYMLQINYLDIWNRQNESNYLANIILERSKQIAIDLRIPSTSNPPRIGSNFYSSLKSNNGINGGIYSSKVLDTCSKIILDTELIEIRPFTKSETDKDQRTSSRGLAWRVHISKSAEAMRLMYWRDGSIFTFSNIGPKAELKIYD